MPSSNNFGFVHWAQVWIPWDVVFHWRLSSLKPISILVWSNELMFKIWGRSDQWLFIWRSSLFECRLHWNLFWLWFGPMSLCLKFEEFSGYCDIQFFIFWGHLPFEVVFHSRSSSSKPFLTLVWSHELIFKILGRSDQWLLRYSTFHILRSSSIRGRLPLKVVFIETFFVFGLVPWAYV